ncbi:MAG: hypothetical protein AAF611_11440 [Bacteroidota bacterium]
MNDLELLINFESSKISKTDWNHKYHLRLAFVYSKFENLETTIAKMRKGIKALNKVHDVPETQYRGYNETKTQAWARIVFKRVKNNSYENSMDFLASEKDLLDSQYLSRYYDQSLLSSKDAKYAFIKPKNNVELI